MGFYDLLNSAIILTLIVFALIYLWDWAKGHDKKPGLWVASLKSGLVSKSVRSLYRSYPDKDRFMLFWLQLNRLEHEGIAGAIAELGVYRGQTAALLRQLAPDRPLHLFDTFSGFRSEDLKGESGEAGTYTTANFADTSLSFVKNKLGDQPGIHYHAGNFSEVIAHLTNTIEFALVSIDVDLEKPTAEGLAWFYPRLVKGGVLVVHDYNPKWPGLMQAVDDFLKTIPENPVLMTDRDSSLVIVKNS